MRRLPNLNQIKAFEAAARHLSFKAAAEELFVSDAAVGHQIKALEEALGEKLFFLALALHGNQNRDFCNTSQAPGLFSTWHSRCRGVAICENRAPTLGADQKKKTPMQHGIAQILFFDTSRTRTSVLSTVDFSIM